MRSNILHVPDSASAYVEIQDGCNYWHMCNKRRLIILGYKDWWKGLSCLQGDMHDHVHTYLAHLSSTHTYTVRHVGYHSNSTAQEITGKKIAEEYWNQWLSHGMWRGSCQPYHIWGQFAQCTAGLEGKWTKGFMWASYFRTWVRKKGQVQLKWTGVDWKCVVQQAGRSVTKADRRKLLPGF